MDGPTNQKIQVKFQCWNCLSLNTVQTDFLGKAKYSALNVPIYIAVHLLGNDYNCSYCKEENKMGGTNPENVTLMSYPINNDETEQMKAKA